MKKKIAKDEIDFIDIIVDIWDNKFKILLITLIIIILASAYIFSKKPRFLATTKIEKISIFEENFYKSYNTMVKKIELDSTLELISFKKNIDEDIKQDLITKLKLLLNREVANSDNNFSSSDFSKFAIINKNYLQNIFIAKIKDRKIIEDAINKFGLVDKKKFKNNDLYLEAIQKLAFNVELLPPKKKVKDSKSKDYWEIQFQTINVEKWNKILRYVNSNLNNEIRKELIADFNRQKKIRELLHKFELEDINKKIINYKKDNKIIMEKKLAFLNQHRAIARDKNLADNTTKDQINDNASSTDIIDLQNQNSYYKKGYKLIEEEIELIKFRLKNNIPDENLLKLENDKSNIIENNYIKRLEDIFFTTPINKPNSFKAANLMYLNTKFEASQSKIKILLISTIIGLLIGILYVSIYGAIQKRK